MSTKPIKYAFIFGDHRTGWMAPNIGQRELNQHPEANLHWYDCDQMDSYLALKDAKIKQLEDRIDELNDPPPTVSDCADCYDDGQAAGLAQGRADGAIKLAAYIEAESDPAPVEPTADKTTKQLLNELYHDRARLERYNDNFAELASNAAEAIGQLYQEVYGEPPVASLSQKAVDLLIIAGQLRQVADEGGVA